MSSAGQEGLDHLLAEIRGEFPAFRIVPKEGDRLSSVVDKLLKVATFGAQSEYLTRYHTVLGDTLYVPTGWEETPPVRKMILLRHERVHLRQRRRYGTVFMSVLYMLPLFPMGAAYGRARIEWEAYEETLRATAELEGLEAAKSPALRAHVIRQFTSGAYGWMWPFPSTINQWYERALRAIVAEVGASRAEVQG
jgi:hypothetical protein